MTIILSITCFLCLIIFIMLVYLGTRIFEIEKQLEENAERLDDYYMFLTEQNKNK